LRVFGQFVIERLERCAGNDFVYEREVLLLYVVAMMEKRAGFERYRIMLVEPGQGQATTGPNRVDVIQRVGLNAYEFVVPWYKLRLIFFAPQIFLNHLNFPSLLHPVRSDHN